MKKYISYILTVIITALVAGGSIWLLTNNTQSSETDVNNIKNEISSLSKKLSRKNHSFAWTESNEETAKKAKSIYYDSIPTDQDNASTHIAYIENQIRMLYKNFTDEIEKSNSTEKTYEDSATIYESLYKEGLKNLGITTDMVKKNLGEPAEIIKESETKEIWPYEIDLSNIPPELGDGEPMGYLYYFENGILYHAEKDIYWGPDFQG